MAISSALGRKLAFRSQGANTRHALRTELNTLGPFTARRGPLLQGDYFQSTERQQGSGGDLGVTEKSPSKGLFFSQTQDTPNNPFHVTAARLRICLSRTAASGRRP